MKGTIKNLSLRNKSIQIENIGKDNKVYNEWYEVPDTMLEILEIADIKEKSVDFLYEYKDQKKYLKKFEIVEGFKSAKEDNYKNDYWLQKQNFDKNRFDFERENKEKVTKLALLNTATEILKTGLVDLQNAGIDKRTEAVKNIAKELYNYIYEDWR